MIDLLVTDRVNYTISLSGYTVLSVWLVKCRCSTYNYYQFNSSEYISVRIVIIYCISFSCFLFIQYLFCADLEQINKFHKSV